MVRVYFSSRHDTEDVIWCTKIQQKIISCATFYLLVIAVIRHINRMFDISVCVDIFRGCYKGEYGVDPSLFGCHRQADSMYCFCEGDRCNHQQAPPEDDLKKFSP